MSYSSASINAIEKVIQLMNKLGVASSSDLVGVPEQEIKALEKCLEHKLPEYYRLFLQQFGRSAGFLSPWLAIYFDDLTEIKQQFTAQNSALESPIKLPENTLLISNCESVFDGINLTDSNPQIQRWDTNISGPQGTIVAKDFAKYLESIVKNSNSLIIPEDFLSDEDELYKEDVINF